MEEGGPPEQIGDEEPTPEEVGRALDFIKSGLAKEFKRKHLQSLAKAAYDTADTIRAATLEHLQSAGLPQAKAQLIINSCSSGHRWGKRDYTAAFLPNPLPEAAENIIPSKWMQDPEKMTVDQVWETYCIEGGVEKTFLSVESLDDPKFLPHSPEPFAALRWLYLCTNSGLHPDVSKHLATLLLKARKQKTGLEVQFHPLNLVVYQAAIEGQEGLKFLAENKSKDNQAREDIPGYAFSLDSNDWEHFTANEGKDGWYIRGAKSKGFTENSDGLAKILQATLVHVRKEDTEDAVYYGTLFVRLEAIWIVRMDFKKNKLDRLSVGPNFPHHTSEDPSLPLCKNFHRHEEIWTRQDYPLKDNSGPMPQLPALLKLEDPIVPNAFKRLVDLGHLLAEMAGHSRTKILWRHNGLRTSYDISEADLIHHSSRCCILRLAERDGEPLKVSSKAASQHEASMLSQVSGVAHVRSMEPQAMGFVRGAGQDLHGLMYTSWYPTTLTSAHISTPQALDRVSTQICTAVKGTHARRIFHRDIKANNCFMDSQGNLHLGDFDAACRMDAPAEVLEREAGSASCRSSRPLHAPFTCRDDWESVGLMMAILMGLRTEGISCPPAVSLSVLMSHPATPQVLVQSLTDAGVPVLMEWVR